MQVGVTWVYSTSEHIYRKVHIYDFQKTFLYLYYTSISKFIVFKYPSHTMLRAKNTENNYFTRAH